VFLSGTKKKDKRKKKKTCPRINTNYSGLKEKKAESRKRSICWKSEITIKKW
jgi:hypothetical protein